MYGKSGFPGVFISENQIDVYRSICWRGSARASPFGVLQSAANQNRSIAGGDRSTIQLVAEHCEAGEGYFVPSQSEIRDFCQLSHRESQENDKLKFKKTCKILRACASNRCKEVRA